MKMTQMSLNRKNSVSNSQMSEHLENQLGFHLKTKSADLEKPENASLGCATEHFL